MDPTLDPLSNQVWKAYLKLPGMLEEPFTILDAGCMSAFLYHHLSRYKKDFVYTGIDAWPEAIMVGKEAAPGLDLRVCNLFEFGGETFDYVVCSNLKWEGDNLRRAREHLIPMARRKCIFIHPGSEIDVYGN